MPSFKKKKRPSSLKTSESKGAPSSVTEDNPDSDDEGGASALALAEAARSRRAVLNGLAKKQVTASDTLKVAAVTKAERAKQEKDSADADSEEEGKERQNLNFSGATGKTAGADGVLEMKKKQIMEEYIARNGSVKPDEVEDEIPKNQVQDDDHAPVGSTVLGGTGIAEVVLPKTYHAPPVGPKKKRPDDTYGPSGPSNLPAMPGYDFKATARARYEAGAAANVEKTAPSAAAAQGRRDSDRPGFKPDTSRAEARQGGVKRNRYDTGSVKDDQFFRKYMK
eukprot:CAMPEP_0182466290 /NCGR_PEP_ID=MMETSP1319-20130603/11684_1 /TAXON_ID=172717 /ORGANISM="Bolidomonas pacifica, Strain RCC208" /LENGTH=279 /DNA_ID=CAMNT_0024666253 /DNA_START=53 /DNA_END=889 /DNA_ORIENTATION=-